MGCPRVPFWDQLYFYTSHAEKVFILQKRVIRILADTAKLKHCKPLFKSFKVLTVPSLYSLGDIHNYSTRQIHRLEIPLHRL